MQKTIMKHLVWVNGILIGVGMVAHFALHNGKLMNQAFMIAAVVGVVPIFIQAVQSLRIRLVSIDVLVTVAVVGAFVIQNYEEAAIVVFLFLFGALLEKKTIAKTRASIKALTEMAPDKAWRKIGSNQYESVAIEQVNVGDILRVKTGGMIPVDGVISNGSGLLNEASITGEAMRVNKTQGASVYAGTLLENGTIEIQTELLGGDTTFGKIIALVEEAQDMKSKAERFIDRFSMVYTPAVLVFALVVWLISHDVRLMITVLVLGCPGALVIGVPVANVAGIGSGAHLGVLMKGSEVIHRFSKVDTFVFDKTGTLTSGKPSVRAVEYFGHHFDEDVALLGSIEQESDHPLAHAILNWVGDKPTASVTDIQNLPGGIQAVVLGQVVMVGNKQLMTGKAVSMRPEMRRILTQLEEDGHSLVIMAVNEEVRMILGIKDAVRPEVEASLAMLRRRGIKHFAILSGDNQGAVNRIAKTLRINHAYGGLMPEDKAKMIQNFQQRGQTVCFVGDGINDSPSIAVADIGIAMGSGTDVAIETSDIVLVQEAFHGLPNALNLAKRTTQTMKQNILIAVLTVVFLIVALFQSTWMTMAVGMFVHEASILAVIINSMRLRKT